MNNIEKNIFFHINALKKSRGISAKILQDLFSGDINSAISLIQNRDELLNIIFKLHRTIENQILDLAPHTKDEIDFYLAWGTDVEAWSIKETSSNAVIEDFLLKEREATTKEIAAIFDRKSRHKGYDLSSTK